MHMVATDATAAAGFVSTWPARHSVFEFSSSVHATLWKEVETLFYFHPKQQALRERIRACVDEFGTPEILERGERIHVGIAKNGAQCLFACHTERRPGVPVGVVVYLRTSPELLRILHLAVHPAYEGDGRHAALNLTMELVDEVRHLARRISGVRRVQLPYVRGAYLSVPRGVG
jgi:predicted GNAT family acetyltransferase